ncbi:MAG: serine/threonine-protein kinase [Rhodopila sp.]
MTNATQPRHIGRYQIVDVLGAGSIGVVYKAYDPAIGRDVAVNLVRISADSTREHVAAVERLRIEARAAGRCQHPGIISVFDFVEQADGTPAIVMEFVEGRSLHGHLRDKAARAVLDPIALVRQILTPLGYAHGQGIIHRDIKPANIMITTAGAVKIADFGIARLRNMNATMTGATLGTPNYMAPEQLGSGPVDERADLFAVGAILYELLAGKPPFSGQNTAEVLAQLAGPAPADLLPIPITLRPIVARALAKDRTQRFHSADEFATALAAAASGQSVPVADDQTLVMASGTGGTAPASAFDSNWLRSVERELASYHGPMARLLVTRAAQASATQDALLATLAEHLPNPADRTRFLRTAGTGHGQGSAYGSRGLGSQGSARGGTGPGTGQRSLGTRNHSDASARHPFHGVSNEAAAAAQAALVQHVGPIARVLVRQAADQANSARDFIELLCAHVTKPGQQAILRRRLAAEVEPKLG